MTKITTRILAEIADDAICTLYTTLIDKSRDGTIDPVEAFQLGKLTHTVTIIREVLQDLTDGKINYP